MEEISLHFIEEDCNGCHACEIACKQEHGLDVGPQLVSVIEKSPRFIPVYCHHCDDPPCGSACPVEAITRDERGIVLINEELCNGCEACVDACPYGAMQYDKDRELAVKCDFCNERLTRGEAPACSLACPAHCIIWGNMSEIPDRIEVV